MNLLPSLMLLLASHSDQVTIKRVPSQFVGGVPFVAETHPGHLESNRVWIAAIAACAYNIDPKYVLLQCSKDSIGPYALNVIAGDVKTGTARELLKKAIESQLHISASWATQQRFRPVITLIPGRKSPTPTAGPSDKGDFFGFEQVRSPNTTMTRFAGGFAGIRFTEGPSRYYEAAQDRTGLHGKFDIALTYSRNPKSIDDALASIGLKLTLEPVTVKVLVVKDA